MQYQILIGGAAGQGMDTSASILEKIVKTNGCEVFSTRDYMSRVRGGHNFINIILSEQPIHSHQKTIHVMIALNKETYDIHREELSPEGIVIVDSAAGVEGPGVLVLDLAGAAKELGNARVSGSVGVGACMKIFGLPLESARAALEDNFGEKLFEVNMQAVAKGYAMTQTRFSVSCGQDSGKMLINGNECIALGALASGLKFYSAYPMTPSTSIMNYLAQKMEEAKIVVEQAEDEIAGINMAIGASYAGVRAMTGTSGGGLCLKVEAVGLSGMMEVPLVIANIMRPGPVTGLPTRTEQSDLSFVLTMAHGEFPRMVLAVRDQEDAFYQTMRAFNLADKYQIPVIILGDQYLADCVKTVEPFDFDRIPVERHLADPAKYADGSYKRYALTPSGISDRLIPGRCGDNIVEVDSDEHDEAGHIIEDAQTRIEQMDKRMRKLEGLRQEIIEPEIYGDPDAKTVLIGWGSTSGPIRKAIELLNDSTAGSYGALVFGDLLPLPEQRIRAAAGRGATLINVEQNATGQLALHIRSHTGIAMDRSILKYDGRQIDADEIVAALKGGA